MTRIFFATLLAATPASAIAQLVPADVTMAGIHRGEMPAKGSVEQNMLCGGYYKYFEQLGIDKHYIYLINVAGDLAFNYMDKLMDSPLITDDGSEIPDYAKLIPQLDDVEIKNVGSYCGLAFSRSINYNQSQYVLP